MSDDIYLTDLIDIETLQELQDAFSDFTGMAAITTDKNGIPVTNYSNFSEFCLKYTRQSELGNKRCVECNKTAAEEVLFKGSPCSYHCHAGLVYYAAPIMANGKIVGSFIGGQVLTEKPDLDNVRSVAKELNIPEEEYIEAIDKVHIKSIEDVKKSSKFLYMIANLLSHMAYSRYSMYQSKNEVEKTSHMKSDFLANMSHEIRTPMNAVLGMAEMALREDMSPAAKDYVRQIKSSGKTLLAIINDILDFSKIESGKLEIIEDNYEIINIIKDVTNMTMARIGAKDIEFLVDLNPMIPRVLHGDAVRIQQIFINILTNAVKFTKKGSIQMSVDFMNLDSGRILLMVSIKDSGSGIKKEDIGKLFSSFQQVDSKRNRMIEGTGLGLAICKNLVQLMEGDIHVESKYREGSTFSFEITQQVVDTAPIVEKFEKSKQIVTFISNSYVDRQIKKDLQKLSADVLSDIAIDVLGKKEPEYLIIEESQFDEALQQYVMSHPKVNAILITDYNKVYENSIPNLRILKKPVYCDNLAIALGIKQESDIDLIEKEESAFHFKAPDAKILIVDDNAINLTVAIGLLEPLGMRIDEAYSAKEAIECISKVKYDLIFMDHMMPEVDGIEATHIIRRMFSNYKSVPIIALTANAVSGAEEMFIREGMNDIVAKPIETKVILSKLKKWLPEDKIVMCSAEEAKALEKCSDDMEIPEIQGLDTKQAISLLGSTKLFWSVLKDYYKVIDKKTETIRKHFYGNKTKDYTIEVHALKSASRQIGAMELAKQAELLEKAGNEGDWNYICDHTEEMLLFYQSYKKILSFYVEEKEENTEFNGIDTSKVIIHYLEKIQEAINQFDVLAIEEMVDTLREKVKNQADIQYLEQLLLALEDNDMDKCESVVNEWGIKNSM